MHLLTGWMCEGHPALFLLSPSEENGNKGNVDAAKGRAEENPTLGNSLGNVALAVKLSVKDLKFANYTR